MINKLTELRNEAFKNGDKVARNAYNAVITECQTAKGRGVELTEKKVLSILKKEIQKYTEMKTRQYEVDLLSALLPEEKPQLTEKELRDRILLYTGKMNPGIVMRWLDDNGYEDQYNKGLVAKIVLGK